MKRALDMGYDLDCYLLELDGPSGTVRIKAEFEPEYLFLTVNVNNHIVEFLLRYTPENVGRLLYLYYRYVSRFLERDEIEALATGSGAD